MNLRRLLRMRRLRALGPTPGKGEWKPLVRPEGSRWEKIARQCTLFGMPAMALLLVPTLAGKLTSMTHDDCKISIVEKEINLPREPPPDPAFPEALPEKKEQKPEPKKIKEKAEETKPDEEPQEKDEKEADEKSYGIDENSLTEGPGSGLAVPVGGSLMGAPGEKKPEKKPEPVPPPPPPPKKNKEPSIYSAEQVTQEPRCLKKVPPEYPDKALDENVEGKVVLMVVFDREGKVKSIEALSKLGRGLEDACMEAVKKSKYAPAVLNDRPVPCKMKMTFNFKLQ
jgi:TonB family protein